MKLLPILLALLLSPYPPNTLSAPTTEWERGQTYTVTAVFYRDAPASFVAEVWTPTGIAPGVGQEVKVDGVHGTQVTWHLTVAPDAPMSRVPVTLRLAVDWQQVATMDVRIWTDTVIPPPVQVHRVWLPMLQT